MSNDQYIYQDRAVVFLDVLGFQEKLEEFETEAEKYKEENETEYLNSEGVNDFITTFKSVVSILDDKNFNYYLFSDNICITVDYSENHNLLIDILITINDLFLKFAEKGYFLRGGLDIGKFVVDDMIAVGVPLANAYKLEQSVAVFPRIVLSENYCNLLDTAAQKRRISEEAISKKKLLVKKHCEVYYLNTFFNLIGNDNKITILKIIKASIEKNLTNNLLNEKVTIKYEWLASEFNLFLDDYIKTSMYLETNIELEKSEIKEIQSLKIQYYGG